MASNDVWPVVSSKNPSPEKRKGISRKKKSASQTEVLEKAYAGKIMSSESLDLCVPVYAHLYFWSNSRSCRVI